jgi:hypothetical protein
LFKVKTEKILENPQKYSTDDYNETPCSKQIEDIYLMTREREQQTNPFMYDIALAFRKDLSEGEALSKVTRYETAHRRALHAALQELHRLQDRCGPSSAPVPHVIDVDEADGGH